MALAAIPSYNFPIQSGSIFDLIFHQTSLTIKVLGFPPNGYTINLIGLIILLILALAVNAIVERLTSQKVGGLFAAVMITIIGEEKRTLLEQAIADGQSSRLPIGRVLAEAEQPIDIHWCP